MSKLITINTEKSIPSKKYKPPVFIALVASMLIFSILSTSIFASSTIGIDNESYLYLMSMDAVCYAGFNNVAGDVYSVASWPQTYYNSVDGDLQQGVTNNVFNFGLYGRLVSAVDLGFKPYVYMPLMLQDVTELRFNIFIASDYTIGKTPSVSINGVSILDFNGYINASSNFFVEIDDITNSYFYSTSGQAFNNI